MLRPRRKWVILAVALALPVVIIVGKTYYHARALASYKKDLLARGVRIDWHELRPAPVPDAGDNASPGLMSGAGLFPTNFNSELVPGMQFVAPGKVVVMATREDWRSLWHFHTPPGDRDGTNWNWVYVSNVLARATPSFDKIHAALQLPRRDYHLEYQRGFEMMLPHLAQERRISQALRYAALAELHAGHRDAALTNILDICTLARLQRDEPIIISQMVRMAGATLGLQATWQALQSPGWSDDQLARLQAGWQQVSFLPDIQSALEMERAIVLMVYDRCRYDVVFRNRMLDQAIQQIASQPGSPLNDNSPYAAFRQGFDVWLLHLVWARCWEDIDELEYLKRYERYQERTLVVIKQRDLSAAGPRPRDSESLLPTGPKLSDVDLQTPLASLVSVNDWISQVVIKELRIETFREMTIAATALERFKLRHGAYPANLVALVPEFLPELPRDYMNGQPLHYRVKPDGRFLLYSVGEDGKDDGGDPRRPDADHDTNHGLEYGRDIVWPEPASEADIADYQAGKNK